MKTLSLILILNSVINCVASQPNSRYIYIPDDNKFVLSENIYLNRSVTFHQKFNSMFIWQKNRVIRIIFKYEEEIPQNQFVLSKNTIFDSIIPQIKDYKIFVSIKKNNPYHNLILSDTGKKGGDISTAIEQKYKLKIMLNINRWNYTNNQFADTLATSVISADEGYMLVKNQNRIDRYTNNLPLAFKLNDSFFCIKPYRIDIYEQDSSFLLEHDHKNHLKKYTLYTTVSLMDNSFADTEDDTSFRNEEEYNQFMERFISYHTWPSVFEFSLPGNPAAVINYLSHFPIAQYSMPESPDLLPSTQCIDIPNSEFIEEPLSSYNNSFTQNISDVNGFENCFLHYSFCRKCNDPAIPIITKIKNYCPINVIPQKGSWPAENWSLLFSYGKHSFFKAEQTIEQNLCGEPKFWQLFSPGIGFWMSNITFDNIGQYFIPDIDKPSFLINNQLIRNFKN